MDWAFGFGSRSPRAPKQKARFMTDFRLHGEAFEQYPQQSFLSYQSIVKIFPLFSPLYSENLQHLPVTDPER
jgi:hypothetical protein